MMIPTLAALSLIAAPAQAGKLADGWNGQPWGPVTLDRLRANAPGRCKTKDSSGTNMKMFVCNEAFGDMHIDVAYTWENGFFWGVMMMGSSLRECKLLLEVMNTAYGMSSPRDPEHSRPSDAISWKDGQGLAVLKPTNGGDGCYAAIIHTGYRDDAKKTSKY